MTDEEVRQILAQAVKDTKELRDRELEPERRSGEVLNLWLR